MFAGQKHTVELSSEKDPGPSKKAPKRQVTKSAFEKWQREHKRQYSTLSWFCCELDREKVHMVSLSCAACKKYEPYIVSLKNFSKAWISGSTNLKVSNLLDHATSEVHKVAMTQMHAGHAKASGECPAMSSTIGRYLSMIDEGTRARMRRKFDVCYVMEKYSFCQISSIAGAQGPPWCRFRPCLQHTRFCQDLHWLQYCKSAPGLCQRTFRIPLL